MLSLLITILIVCVILAVFVMIIRALPLPALWKNIAIAIVLLIVLVGLLQHFGMVRLA